MGDNQRIEVGRKMKGFRYKRGYTQEEFSQKLGITRRTLSLIETGKKKVSSNVLKKMLKFFPDVDLSWLTGEEGSVNDPQAPYVDTIESRLSRIEKKLDLLIKKLDDT